MGWIDQMILIIGTIARSTSLLVIAAMNTGQGPDGLGVCEVENPFVVDQTAGHGQRSLPEANPIRRNG
jgi:hypothetical protein